MNDEELKKMVQEIHSAIVGDICGNLGLLERVRILETFKNSILKRYNGVMGFIAVNIGTFIISTIFICLKFN